MSAAEPAHIAADPGRSAWVSAHAGSGKTYTLANRVTRLLLDGAKPERILCLTYTKTAAAEMQHRLFKQLGEWAMLPAAKLAESIAAIGGGVRDAGGLNHARRLFALALETPGGLKIQTIHAFCQTLLSRFPLEAGIPPGFTVLDDQTARELIAQARAAVLERAGSGDEQLAAATAYMVTQTSEGKLEDILGAALGSDRGRLEQVFASAGDDPEALHAKLRQAAGSSTADSFERIAAEFCARAERDRTQLGQIVAWLSDGGKDDAKRAAKLTAALERSNTGERFEALCAALLNADGAKPKKLAVNALIAKAPQLHEALARLSDAAFEAQERCRAARAALIAEAALTLAGAVRRAYTSEKQARGVLDYNDLIAATRDLLTRRQAAAWVLYKLDGGLDHILIDEAQDTSPQQWDIVKALSEEFFAGESARAGPPRTIFAVGDEKQSIFSFQGADPVQFEVNRRHFAALASGAAADGFADVELDTSRRSAPEILRFVDEVFASPEARDGLTSSDHPIVHRAHRCDAKGRVEFWPAIKPAAKADIDVWAPVDAVREDSPVRGLAIRVAQQIARWTDGRTRLPGHEAAIRPGDILILMPRREPFASEIIRQLKERGIPVAGADRIKLTKQIAVMDLIALGRFALLPEDDLNLAALLRSPMLAFSEDELYALCQPRTATLWRELEQREHEGAAYGFACAFLKEMRRIADFVPPFEFYAAALARHGMMRRLIARLGADAADAIEEFHSLTLTYEAHNTPSLEGFLFWLERGETEIKRDMEKARDEVRVMTVHGAKGLEADIVILPDTTSLPQPPGRSGELLYTDDAAIYPLADREAPPLVKAAKEAAAAEALKEHRRLLYVALTRARDQLYICGFENSKGVREGSWYAHCERAARALGQEEERGGETILAYGAHPLERREAESPAPPLRTILPDWARSTAPAEILRPRIIRPSDAGDGEPPLSAPPGQGAAIARRGQLVHTLLARLPGLPEAARAAAAARFLRTRKIADEAAAALIAEVLAVLAHPDFAPAFAADARAEVPIVAELPELGAGARIAGRIDRLAVTAACVLAIDFKTGAPAASLAAIPRLYLTQMALYRAGLAKIFPDRPIACALIWTAGPSLSPLPDALLDGELQRFSDRLANS